MSIRSYLLIVLVPAACAHAPGYPREKMLHLAAALTDVARACDTVLDSNPELDGDALLKAATHDQPDLLEPFPPYAVRAQNVNHHAVLLVCDGPEKLLIEDAGCTGESDARYWEGKTHPKCEATLDLAVVCPKPEPKAGPRVAEQRCPPGYVCARVTRGVAVDPGAEAPCECKKKPTCPPGMHVVWSQSASGLAGTCASTMRPSVPAEP